MTKKLTRHNVLYWFLLLILYRFCIMGFPTKCTCTLRNFKKSRERSSLPRKETHQKNHIHLRVCVCDLLIYPSGKGGRKREREKVLVTEMYKGGEREWNGEKTLRDEFQGKKGPRNKQKLPFPPLRPRVFLEFQSTSASLKKLFPSQKRKSSLLSYFWSSRPLPPLRKRSRHKKPLKIRAGPLKLCHLVSRTNGQLYV